MLKLLIYMTSGNRFSKKKREKEKAQEDMAWQIAKMIINEIHKEVSHGNKTPILEEQKSNTGSESTHL